MAAPVALEGTLNGVVAPMKLVENSEMGRDGQCCSINVHEIRVMTHASLKAISAKKGGIVLGFVENCSHHIAGRKRASGWRRYYGPETLDHPQPNIS
jgi:hypothetical protein